MDARTRQQENKYNQALGYAWGAKDATPYSSSTSREVHSANSVSFATFYSMLEALGGHHRPLEDAWQYFRSLSLAEQDAYGRVWMRAPWNPYTPTESEKVNGG